MTNDEKTDSDVTSPAVTRDVTPPSPRDADDETSLSSQTKWNRSHPLELLAHQTVRSALKRGLLEKGACSVEGCTDTDIVAHHEDYYRPLHVTWFCRTHHQKHHAAERAASKNGGREVVNNGGCL